MWPNNRTITETKQDFRIIFHLQTKISEKIKTINDTLIKNPKLLYPDAKNATTSKTKLNKTIENLFFNILKYEISNHIKFLYFNNHIFIPTKLVLLCLDFEKSFSNDPRLYYLKIYSAKIFTAQKRLYLQFNFISACLERYKDLNKDDGIYTFIKNILLLINKMFKTTLDLYLFTRENYTKVMGLLEDFKNQLNDHMEKCDKKYWASLPLNYNFYSTVQEACYRKFGDFIKKGSLACNQINGNELSNFLTRFKMTNGESYFYMQTLNLISGFNDFAVNDLKKDLKLSPLFENSMNLSLVLNMIDEYCYNPITSSNLCLFDHVIFLSPKHPKMIKYLILNDDALMLTNKTLVVIVVLKLMIILFL
jgi:hypothetical protein